MIPGLLTQLAAMMLSLEKDILIANDNVILCESAIKDTGNMLSRILKNDLRK